jgi:hypothetical protein
MLPKTNVKRNLGKPPGSNPAALRVYLGLLLGFPVEEAGRVVIRTPGGSGLTWISMSPGIGNAGAAVRGIE